MGKSSKNSITRSSTRPARRARRGTAAAETVAVEAAAAPVEAAAAPVEAAPVEAAPVEAAPVEAAAPGHHQVQQLAFHYYAESGFAQGNALDHWLRAETELGGE